MIDFLLKNGYWFYKDCGCAIPGRIYKNLAGYEVRVTKRTEEFVVSRDGMKLENGITSHYRDKMQKYL